MLVLVLVVAWLRLGSHASDMTRISRCSLS